MYFVVKSITISIYGQCILPEAAGRGGSPWQKKDAALEKYFQDNERFADLLNAVLFQGKQVIKPGDVREQDSAVKGLVKRGCRRFLIQKYRDALRKIALGMSFVVVGIEHQDQTHFAMPVRVMLSDAAAYDRQVQKIGRMHRKKRGSCLPFCSI